MRPFAWSTGRVRSIAGWVGLALLFLGLSVAALFPYDRLQARLLTVAGQLTGTTIRAQEWEWAWPVGFRWRNASLTGPLSLDAAELEARPSLTALAAGKPGARITASLRIPGAPSMGQGLLHLQLGGWSLESAAHAVGSVDRVSLSALDPTLIRSGMLRVAFTHRWDKASDAGRMLQGEGTWEILLADATADRLPLGPFTLAPAALSVVKARLTCAGGRCEFGDFLGESPEGTATGSGTLTPRLPIRDSLLDAAIDVVPSLSLVQKVGSPLVQAGVPIRLTLSGPVARLTVRL